MTGPEEQYKLRVSLRIEKWIRYGGEGDRYQPTQEALSINEDVELGSLDFMGAMGVMGRLHDAIQTVRPEPTS